MRRWIAQILGGAVVFLAAQSASATALYSNGAPNLFGGQEATQWIQAEDFLLASSATISQVRFWSLEDTPGYAGSIEWAIHQNNSGQPGSILAQGTANPTHISTGRSTPDLVEFQLDFSVGAVNLNAGTYWLSIHNGPTSQTARQDFLWELTDPSALNSVLLAKEDIAPFDGGWATSRGDRQGYAFELNPVPEPASVLLIGLGLAGAIVHARRRQK